MSTPTSAASGGGWRTRSRPSSSWRSKLLFGTDVLRHDQGEADVPIVGYFRHICKEGKLSEEAFAKIAGRNAHRLLGL